MNTQELSKQVKTYHAIDKSLYPKYEVKRGLRNSDGSGVLVGLTKIGDVHGYIKDELDVIPVHGELRYRGIEVKEILRQLSAEERYGFEEIVHLLVCGTLPNKGELENFSAALDMYRELPAGFTENMILKSPSNNVMNKLARCVLAYYSYDSQAEDLQLENIIRQSIDLIAKFPTILAYAYQAKAHYFDKKTLFLHSPEPGIGTAKNFLRLIREQSEFSELEARTLDACLILHAEHGGGNNSTFTTHVVSSAHTDTYSVIAAAIGSLKGARHGGANIRVLQMIDDLKRHVSDWEDEGSIQEYLFKLLKKEAFDKSGLIYGIGHGVYTLSDPRVEVLKGYAKSLAKEKDKEKEFQLYCLIEQLAPDVVNNHKNTQLSISANVDFYSGFVYELLNIPRELHTPVFAMARIAGWCAHRIEEMISGEKIIRPAYKSVQGKHSYLPIQQR